MNSDRMFIVTHFYSDTKIGTGGQFVKEWHDPSGCHWIKLFFGLNAGGQKMMKSFPADCLQQIEPIPELILDHFGGEYIIQMMKLNEDLSNNNVREAS